jgi:hypothetical protein
MSIAITVDAQAVVGSPLPDPCPFLDLILNPFLSESLSV